MKTPYRMFYQVQYTHGDKWYTFVGDAFKTKGEALESMRIRRACKRYSILPGIVEEKELPEAQYRVVLIKKWIVG